MLVSPDQAAELLKYGGALGVVVLLILLCSAFVFRMLDQFSKAVHAMGQRFDRLEDRVEEGFNKLHDLVREDARPTLPDLPNGKVH